MASLGLCAALAAAATAGLSGCEGADDGDVETVQGALTTLPPPGINGAVPPGLESSPVYQAYIASLAKNGMASTQSAQGLPETLADYAAACDAASGIHVPAFNCANGTEVPQGTVQTGLTNANIGITGGTRTESIAPEGIVTETITAGGADIWGTSDQFFFAYKGITGDGYAEMNVTGLTNSDPFAKAGVMFRDGTAANAPNVMMAITPSSGAILQKRLTAGATSTNTIVTGRTVPTWLRVVRKGKVFTGFVTTDRVTWTQVGSAVTFTTFSAQALVGIAVTSHNTGATTTATALQFAWTPDVAYGSAVCDRPAELTHKCDPGSKFQVVAQSPDATAVAHCRRQGNTTANFYSDIAVIQYNKNNGALCFYQALGTLDGSNVPAPSSAPGTGSLTWFTPLQTKQSNCVGCHDNGGFIRSKYLTQLAALPSTSVAHLLPSFSTGYDNNVTPVRYVGADFAYKAWSVSTSNATGDSGLTCNACHRLGVNNYFPSAGTAGNYAVAATQSTAASKNPHGPTSPIWMRYGQINYDPLALATATKFQDCASAFATAGFPANPAIPGCTFSQFGEPWQPYLSGSFNDLNVGISNGTATHNGTLDTVSARGTDIYGTSDQFMFAVQSAPAGNGLATVKVTGLTNTDPFAKAGIMLRAGIGASDENVMINVTPSSGAVFQYRQTNGGTTTSNILAGVTLPVWLRLVRTGSTFTGWFSSNLVSWTQVGPAVTIPTLASANLVGEAVTSHNTSQSATGSFDYFSWTSASASTLADANIGITGGVRKEVGTKNTITAGGADIYGTSDQFYFAFKSLTGNGTVTARVTALGNTDPYAKAGLMFRSTAAADAPHAMIDITPGQGAGFQTRSTAGGTTTATFVTGNSVPKWLRIKRVSNTFTGYVSNDGSTFTQVGSATTIAGFSSMALFGLAVTSHNTGAQTTATFTDLGLTVP